jgi:hypothetical protein
MCKINYLLAKVQIIRETNKKKLKILVCFDNFYIFAPKDEQIIGFL